MCLSQVDPICACVTSKEAGVDWVIATPVVLLLLVKTQTQAFSPMNGTFCYPGAKLAGKAQQETRKIRTEKQLPHQGQKFRNETCFITLNTGPLWRRWSALSLEIKRLQWGAYTHTYASLRWETENNFRSLKYVHLLLKPENKPLRLQFSQLLCCMSYPIQSKPSAFRKPSW